MSPGVSAGHVLWAPIPEEFVIVHKGELPSSGHWCEEPKCLTALLCWSQNKKPTRDIGSSVFVIKRF